LSAGVADGSHFHPVQSKTSLALAKHFSHRLSMDLSATSYADIEIQQYTAFNAHFTLAGVLVYNLQHV
jgi:hypothetical protein